MESTSTVEDEILNGAIGISLLSVIIALLTVVGLLIVGVGANAWADQLFTCDPYQQYIDGCRRYPGLEDLRSLLTQIGTAMLAILFALNIVVWLVAVVAGLFRTIKRG